MRKPPLRKQQLTIRFFDIFHHSPWYAHHLLAHQGIGDITDDKQVVVRPRNWDEYGKKVKTDQRDAQALTECLSRYVSGNKSALCVVRVPSEEEERRRV